MKNTQIILISRPDGLPNADNWEIRQTAIPTLTEGSFLIQNLYLSLDPAMRGWITDRPSYMPPVQLGDVMRGGAVGKVLSSKNPDFPEGVHVVGWTGIQEYAVSDGKGIYQVDPSLAPLPTYLGTLGMTGFTAYFGLLDVGQPNAGETVLVSGAAGAVGSIVGQIAKIKGCRVVGIAGGPEKCRYILDDLGFDAAIDYKNESLRAGIKRTCPDGIDVYFDNVGGETLDAALARINMKARIVICGAISQYNNTTPTKGPENYLALLVRRARMEGFLVMDYAREYGKAAVEMGGWLAQGKLNNKITIVEGIDTFPESFLKLFSGEKLGKLVLKV